MGRIRAFSGTRMRRETWDGAAAMVSAAVTNLNGIRGSVHRMPDTTPEPYDPYNGEQWDREMREFKAARADLIERFVEQTGELLYVYTNGFVLVNRENIKGGLFNNDSSYFWKDWLRDKGTDIPGMTMRETDTEGGDRWFKRRIQAMIDNWPNQ